MQVTAEYEAQLKRVLGTSQEAYELDEKASLNDLVQAVVDRHGQEARSLFLSENGNVHPALLVFCNDRQLRPARQSDALPDQATVTFVSPISGG